jgi:hypothetical protein
MIQSPDKERVYVRPELTDDMKHTPGFKLTVSEVSNIGADSLTAGPKLKNKSKSRKSPINHLDAKIHSRLDGERLSSRTRMQKP